MRGEEVMGGGREGRGEQEEGGDKDVPLPC